MSRKIKLYGKLAEFVGFKEFDVEIKSVAQAVSFLINNFPHLESYMSPNYYQVKVGNYDIIEDEIHYPTGKDDIHFVPVISGAGRGFGKILLGAALIGLAFMLPGGLAAKIGPGGILKGGITGGFLGKAMVGIGASLVLSGVSDMLFPMPEDDFSEDPRLSFNFSGLQNTSRAGTSVPIVYGEIITGSIAISAAVDTNQVEA
jgi:predicted phage tail protein